MGGVSLPVRNPGGALVLDRGNSSDAVPEPRDDALLLHFKDALRARLSETALRRAESHTVFHLVCLHDRVDERYQYVLHGASHEGDSGLEYPHQHLDFLDYGGDLRSSWRVALGDFQRSAPVHSDLGGCFADSHPRTDRSRRGGGVAPPGAVEARRSLHALGGHNGVIRCQTYGDSL